MYASCATSSASSAMLKRRRRNLINAPWWRRMISWMLKGVALSGTDNGAWSANASTVESIVNAPCTRRTFLQAPCLLPNQKRHAREHALAGAPRLISSVFTVAGASSAGSPTSIKMRARGASYAPRVIQRCARRRSSSCDRFCAYGNACRWFSACSGAGIRPPRATNASLDCRCSAMTGARPSKPPNDTTSPTFLPGAGSAARPSSCD